MWNSDTENTTVADDVYNSDKVIDIMSIWCQKELNHT